MRASRDCGFQGVWILGCAVAVFVLLTPVEAAEMRGSLRSLLAAYRCEVVNRLERIYQRGNPAASDRDRFIAITVREHPHGYVQCIFYEHRLSMLCEASSGFHFDKPGAPRTFRLAPEAVAALGVLGFSTDDSQGNLRREFDVDSPPDFNRIADFMLTALHDGYGARADSALKFNAPFARRGGTTCLRVVD